MPTVNKRINLTVSDDLYSRLVSFRDSYDKRHYRWRHPTPLASIVVFILREYFHGRSVVSEVE